MLIAKIQDGQVVDIADYQSMFPQTSFPDSGPNDEFMLENGCMYVNMFKSYNSETEHLVNVAPYIESEDMLHWVYTVQVEPLPPTPEPDQITDQGE